MSKYLQEIPSYKKIYGFLILLSVSILFIVFIFIYQLQSKMLLETTRNYTKDISQIMFQFIDIQDVENLICENINEVIIEEDMIEFFSNINVIDDKMRAFIIHKEANNLDEIFVMHFNNTLINDNEKINIGRIIDPTDGFRKAMDQVSQTGQPLSTGTILSHIGKNIYSIHPINNQNNQTIAFFVFMYNYDQILGQQKNLLTIICIIFLLVLIIIYWFLYRFIQKQIRPLSNIFDGITEFSKGNFDYQIVQIEPNEYDELTNQLNNMIHQLKELFMELERTSKELNVNKTINTMNQLENAIDGINQIKDSFLTQQDIQYTEKMNAIGQLAASVAHEIRNPLTVVKGFMQLFSQNSNFGDVEQTYIQLMMQEIQRAETIINDYLSLAKPEVCQISKLDLSAQVIKVQGLLTSYAVINNNIPIQIDLEEEIYVIGNENELTQLLINILKNAIEASFEGEAVLVKLRKDENFAYLTIKDQGSGMSEDVLNKLGTPFYSLKEKGTGLGMMVCYQLVKKMNGYIDVTSQLNEGTIFTIQLPLLK